MQQAAKPKRIMEALHYVERATGRKWTQGRFATTSGFSSAHFSKTKGSLRNVDDEVAGKIELTYGISRRYFLDDNVGPIDKYILGPIDQYLKAPRAELDEVTAAELARIRGHLAAYVANKLPDAAVALLRTHPVAGKETDALWWAERLVDAILEDKGLDS